MSTTTNAPQRDRSEVGPSWDAVSRFTRAVHVGLVAGLLLITTAHLIGLHVGLTLEVAYLLLTVAMSLLVSWPKSGPRSP